MIAGSTAEPCRQTNRARHRAMMARLAARGRRAFGIGPFIGPSWPDSPPSKPSCLGSGNESGNRCRIRLVPARTEERLALGRRGLMSRNFTESEVEDAALAWLEAHMPEFQVEESRQQ